MKSKGSYLGLFVAMSLLLWVTLLILGYLPVKVFLVQSGSMEPSIMTGDVVVVSSNDAYRLNEVITFKDKINRVVTHRVVDAKDVDTYITKGDANKNEDRETVAFNQIIGKVVLVVPKLGYLVNFTKTLPGLILFILLPAIYLVFSEIKTIGKELRERR